MRAWPVLLVAACAPAAPPTRPTPAPSPSPARPLTPADVGLPDEPPAEPPAPPPAPVAARPPEPPGYYRREECPARRGCKVIREVTLDRMTTKLDCNGGGYVGSVLLRTLDADIDVGVDGLDRAIVRRVMRRAEPRAKDCFDRDNVAARVELGFTIHHGRVIGPDPAASECLRQVLAGLELPREISFTKVRWTLDYRVKDPATAPRLTCP